MKEKNSQPRILYPEIITFQNEGEIKKKHSQRKKTNGICLQQMYSKRNAFRPKGKDSQRKFTSSEVKTKQQKW